MTEQPSVAITSDDVGEYGLKVLLEDGELRLVRYNRSARGNEGFTEISFDERLAVLVAKSIETLAEDEPDEAEEWVQERECSGCGISYRITFPSVTDTVTHCPGCGTDLTEL